MRCHVEGEGGARSVSSARFATGRIRGLGLLLITLVAGLSVALPARAADVVAFDFLSQFADHAHDPFQDGFRTHHQRIAVEGATGNLLETDTVNDRINVYAPTPAGATLLTSFGAGQLTDPFGIAIDRSSGDVYVTDSGNNRIVRYTSDGAPMPTYTLDAGFTSPALGGAAGEIGGFAAAIAIDQSAQKLLVADPVNDLVTRFRFDGGYDGFSFDGAGSGSVFTGLLDIAVDSTGDVIVVDATGNIAAQAGTSRVLRFAVDGTYEGQIGASLSLPATVAVNLESDDVVISANQDTVHRNDDKPTVDFFRASGAHVASLPVPDSAFYSTVTGIAIDDDPDQRLYVATDVDRSTLYGGLYGLVSFLAFRAVLPSSPSVDFPPPFASDVAITTATVNASIIPNYAATSYYFEYGLSPGAYTDRTAAALLRGTANVPENVRAQLTDLEPDATYYFRVVADNGIGGPVAGTERTFTTVPRPPTVAIGTPTGVTQDSVTIHGTVDAHRGVGGFYRFSVVGVDAPAGQVPVKVDMPVGPGPAAISAAITGLEPGRTYRIGLYATNSHGLSFADPVTFTTPGKPPYDLPPRQPDSVSPYGCAAPKLDPVGGRPRRGQTVTLTGADLGVYGTVAFGGRDADVLTWAANRVTVAVPDDARGRVTLRLDCGNAVETAVTIGELPSNSITVGDPVVKRRVATLRVKVPGKGVLTARGRYLRGSSKRPARSGTTTLRVRLTRAGGRVLSRARGGELRVTVVVRFKPDGGPARTVRLPVFFES